MEAKRLDQQIGEEFEAAAQLKECAKCSAQFKVEINQGYEAGQQEGRREAVEWVASHQLVGPDGYSITMFKPFYQIEQAKLKEWQDLKDKEEAR